MPLIEFGTLTAALDGETQSGDRYLVQPFSGGVLVGVADGVGHGHEAATAAEAALAVLKRCSSDPLESLLRRCHQELRATRGVVLSMASFNGGDATMTWLGVGNVEGVFLRTEPRESRRREALLLRPGMVGNRLPLLQASVIAVERDDVLIFATDGVRSSFAQDSDLGGPPQKLADRIMARYRTKKDDALVLVARYLGEDP